jgi:fructose/tagatose bisphosphate aldolase
MNIDRDGDSANWLAIMSKTKKTEKLKKTKKVLSPKVEEIKQLVMAKMEECSTKKGISNNKFLKKKKV